MGTEPEPIIIRIGDVVQVGEQIRQIQSCSTSVYGPPTIELSVPWAGSMTKSKILFHNDVIDLHGAGFRVVLDDHGPDFHFQSTLWETVEPTKAAEPVEQPIPVILGHHGDVVGHALVRSDGKIIVMELSSDAATIISKGIEWGITKSLTIAPTKEN